MHWCVSIEDDGEDFDGAADVRLRREILLESPMLVSLCAHVLISHCASYVVHAYVLTTMRYVTQLLVNNRCRNTLESVMCRYFPPFPFVVACTVV